MSSIFIDNPQISGEIKKIGIKAVFLWGLSVFFAAAHMDFNRRLKGIKVSFPVKDVLLISISTLMLCYGFKKKDISWAIPWILITTHSIYFIHYQELLKIVLSIDLTDSSIFQWSALIFCILSLITRATLLVKIIQFYGNLWINKKLEQID